ncbi:MAG: hypothetical protein FWC47_02610 [Oscillospiraceae bacterium]|nr:hypothetical protein [Oscillospiraceae bacterium]
MRKGLLLPASALLWCLTVVVYVIVSYSTRLWAVTWLIFSFAVVLQMLLDYMFSPPKFRILHIQAIIWTLSVFIYLLISVITFKWYRTWVIFPITACISLAVNTYLIWGRRS